MKRAPPRAVCDSAVDKRFSMDTSNVSWGSACGISDSWSPASTSVYSTTPQHSLLRLSSQVHVAGSSSQLQGNSYSSCSSNWGAALTAGPAAIQLPQPSRHSRSPGLAGFGGRTCSVSDTCYAPGPSHTWRKRPASVCYVSPYTADNTCFLSCSGVDTVSTAFTAALGPVAVPSCQHAPASLAASHNTSFLAPEYEDASRQAKRRKTACVETNNAYHPRHGMPPSSHTLQPLQHPSPAQYACQTSFIQQKPLVAQFHPQHFCQVQPGTQPQPSNSCVSASDLVYVAEDPYQHYSSRPQQQAPRHSTASYNSGCSQGSQLQLQLCYANEASGALAQAPVPTATYASQPVYEEYSSRCTAPPTLCQPCTSQAVYEEYSSRCTAPSTLCQPCHHISTLPAVNTLPVSLAYNGPEDWAQHCFKSLSFDNPSTLELALHCWRRISNQEGLLQSLPLWSTAVTGKKCYVTVCLWLCAKLEERRCSVPGALALSNMICMSAAVLNEMELQVLRLLDWSPYQNFQPSCTVEELMYA